MRKDYKRETGKDQEQTSLTFVRMPVIGTPYPGNTLNFPFNYKMPVLSPSQVKPNSD